MGTCQSAVRCLQMVPSPVLPQALLVTSAVALGYAPELWPFGEITGTALIVSVHEESRGGNSLAYCCPSAVFVAHAAPVLLSLKSRATMKILVARSKDNAETLAPVGTVRKARKTEKMWKTRKPPSCDMYA